MLRFRGFLVALAADGQQALEQITAQSFSMIVLDVMLPELDGYSVCERIRATGNDVPILMLTAKGAEEDILRGFEVGADDYVTKPFSLRELLARIEAMLRRAGHRNGTAFRAGPLTIDVEKGRATSADLDVELSSREIGMLRLLVEDPGRIISRRAMLRNVWGMNNVEQVETRTVDVHIAKLRKKLGQLGNECLETVRGQGYRWHA